MPTTKIQSKMKRVFLAIALTLGVMGANAQNVEQPETEVVTFQADTYPQEMSGDDYNGLTKKLTFDRMIPPYGMEVTYDKTVHVIFPSAVRYVDLGSPNLIAGKADGAENVIRVKATVKNFRTETNFSVITESGSFYTFNVKYADEPLLLNIEMKDFIHDGSTVNRPNNALDIYLQELGSESPKLVHLIMKSIHKTTSVKSNISGQNLSASNTCCVGCTRTTGCCISTRRLRTRPTCRSMWILSRSKSWIRKWQNALPFRSR